METVDLIPASPMSPALAQDLAGLPQRMSHVVLPWAQRTPDAPALVEGDRLVTFAALARLISQSGQWLKERGLRPGDRAMIVGENCLVQAVLALAIGDIDAWPLVSNARLSTAEIDAIREHAGARLTIYTTGVSPDAARHAQHHGAEAVEVPGLGSFAISAANESVLPEPVYADGARQVGALIYTSGTTGTPKGVMLSHHNVMFTAVVGRHLRDVESSDRIYGVAPMSHIVGFSAVLIGSLMFGASVDLVPRFDPAAALVALRSQPITRLQGVPTMFQRLLEHAGGAPIACPQLRFIGVAGAPLDLSLKAAVERAFGLTMHNGYGITECSPTIAVTLPRAPRTDDAVGPPVPGIEARLAPHGGSPDGIGELHVRGPNVMLGYYRAPEQTAAVIDAQGWFNTGDLARFEGGNLYIVGRSKELIIRSGFNVYPPDVEAVLNTHPAVALSAVVGRAVPGNEEVIAFVQLKPGASATADELAAFAATRLAPYKRPARILVKEALPANATGKLLKHRLAQEAASLDS